MRENILISITFSYYHREGCDERSVRRGHQCGRAASLPLEMFSWGLFAVHSGSIFDHVDVLDLVKVVINHLLSLGLFFPDTTQSHTT